MQDDLMWIAGKPIGPGHPTYVIAEMGINHNGDRALAEAIMHAAADAGVDAVKVQKRTVDVVYTPEELARPRQSVFGETNGDLKRGLELDMDTHRYIKGYAGSLGLAYFASCWDEQAVDDFETIDPVAYKVASASLTDHELLRHIASKGRPMLVSCGMSTGVEAIAAMDRLDDCGAAYLMMYSCSAYPAPLQEINLRCVEEMQGYSGHEPPEVGPAVTLGAVALGAHVVERHITVDRTLWGSDQKASLEPAEFAELVRQIRTLDLAMQGDGIIRCTENEKPVRDKLRRK